MAGLKSFKDIDIDSCNIINDKKIIKNDTNKSKTVTKSSNTTYKKPTKKELYQKERHEVLTKLNQIVGINEANNIIYLYDIDNSLDKQKQISDLSDDVKKYFKCGTWAYFAKTGKGERPQLRYFDLTEP